MHFSQRNYYGQGPAYASMPTVDQKPVTWHRRTLNLAGILMCFLLPALLYAAVTAVLAFNLHYDHPRFTSLLVSLAVLATLVTGFYSRQAKLDAPRDPSWLRFLFQAMLFAVVAACISGNLLYRTYLKSYYDVTSLNHYVDVDPTSTQGQGFMDAGYIVFKNGTFLDVENSMGFMNTDVYCVAPIALKGAAMAAYDFWAVGTNCCSGGKTNFKCGDDFKDPRAHSGLRLMSDENRAFYRLAVQQAEAAHKIHAGHPLFFEWTRDAPAKVDGWYNDGHAGYISATLYFFAFQFLLVLGATLLFQQHT